MCAKEGSAFLTPKHGKCNKGYKLTLLGAEGQAGAVGKAGAEGKEGKPGAEGKAGHEGKTGPEGNLGLTSGELETLRGILPHMSYAASGIGGKPTIRFSAVNVQIVNGDGKTSTTNGEGNLIIGYDENTGESRGGPGIQTGSHNLVVGIEQEFTSFGGLVAGFANSVTGEWSTVTGGEENFASGNGASVSGGLGNKAGEAAFVGGGWKNSAEGNYSSLLGGKELKAKNEFEAP